MRKHRKRITSLAKRQEEKTYRGKEPHVYKDNTKEKINDANRRTTQEDEGTKEGPLV